MACIYVKVTTRPVNNFCSNISNWCETISLGYQQQVLFCKIETVNKNLFFKYYYG